MFLKYKSLTSLKLSASLLLSMVAISYVFYTWLSSISVIASAQAAVVTPSSWVQVLSKPDPMMENLTIPADAASKGMWSSVYDWPMNGLHVNILPDGRVLTFGSTLSGGAQDGRYLDIWDPTLGFADNSHTTTFRASQPNAFCSASVYLNDGSILIAGGKDEGTATALLNPRTNQVSLPASMMTQPRWYSTMLKLPDGRALIMGGMYQDSESALANDPDAALDLTSETPEIYEYNDNTGEYEWRSLFGVKGNGSTIADNSRLAFGPDYLRTSYPRAWVAPNGLVFGISTDRMWYLDVDGNNGNGEIIDAGQFKPPYSQFSPVNVGPLSTAVMYAPGKILQVGGNGGHVADGLPASNMATKIDINGLTPIKSEEPLMTYPRRFGSSIVLANGQVVVTGGTGKGNDLYEPDNQGNIINDFNVLTAEIWTEGENDTPGTWQLGANAAKARFYHSITSLLPNGAILSTGGGTPGPVLNKNAEIYYPPYLFENNNGSVQLASRPVIDAISGLSHSHNAPMQLDMLTNNSVSDLVLVRLSNATHAFNPGQRRIPLVFTQLGNRLTTTIPSANIAPLGYYQLVALNANGVPSLGAVIAIGQDIVPPNVPTEPYTPPDVTDLIEAPIITAGGTANFTVAAQTGVTYSWHFGDGAPDTAFAVNPDVTHNYAQAGLYMVTLRAKDSEGLITFRTFLQAVATTKTALQPTSASAIALEAVTGGDDRIWVVNPDNDSVSVMNAETKVLIATINVDESPRNIAVAPNGNIWVTNKKSATITIINPTTLSVTQTLALPHASQPHGIIFSPDGNGVFVVLEATGQLLKLNQNTGAQIASIDVGLHARHVAASADLATLLVSRFITPPLPGESTALVDVAPTNGAEVVVVNPTTMTVVKTTILQHSNKTDAESQGSGIPNYLASPVISPDGTTAWVPSKQDNIKRGVLRNNLNPDLNLNFQNTVRAISSNINMATLVEEGAKRVDFDNASVASSALYHPSGVYLFVALETSREVAVINAITGFELFRIDVGRAPQGLSISNDGNTLYVQEFMDRSVSVFDLTPLTQQGLLEAEFSNVIYTVATEKLPAEVVVGKQLFYDAKDTRLAKDSYMSCASCHNDGGHDGRVWDMTGFGEGLRNTIDLRGRAGMGHGFLHWSANFDEVHDFEKQIRDLAGGTGLMSDTDFNAGTRSEPLGDTKAGVSQALDSLVAYVTSLDTFAENPNRNVDNTLTSHAQIGHTLFNNHCISCHSGAKLTNSLNAATLQNIGTIKPTSGQRLNGTLTGIDVPTLRGVWATAPYLHDGSAGNISAAIQAHGNGSINLSTPNNASYISPLDLNHIVEYVAQIGLGNEADPAKFVSTWHFNEGAGAIAADSSGNDETLQLNNVSWTAGKVGAFAGQFNGSNANGAPSAPALIDTTASFTVAAWVKLDTLNGWRTIINQDGENVSGFWLQYSQQLGGIFTFTMRGDDSLAGPVNRARSTTKPVVGEWYHLVGIHDKATGTIKLYVNGVLEGSAVNTVTWSATGNFNVGRGKWDVPNDWFAGAIDEVNVYNYPIPESEIEALYQANTAPTVALTSPLAGASIEENTPITLSATASDSDGTISSVAFYDGTTLIGNGILSNSTYHFTWASATVGSHTITALATDDDNETTQTAPINIEVTPVVVITPVVTITAPTAVSEVNTPITLVASASNIAGEISNVQFISTANGTQTPIGTGTLVPSTNTYTFSWTPTTAGNYAISAVVTNNAAVEVTSLPVIFTVNPTTTPPSTQIGSWHFNEGTGAIAADSSGNDETLQLNNANWTTGKVGAFAGQFNGSNASGAPSAPALIDTTKSYTVAAWVKLDTLNGWRTILNQDGENVSGFWLQYSQQLGGKFIFSIYVEDSLSSQVYRATSTTQPVIGEWYHLVGVKDVATGSMKLYVNGVLEAETINPTNWASTGDFNVGRGKWGNPNDWFAGAIDEVNVYDYPITASEVDGLYQQAVATNVAPTVSVTPAVAATEVNTAITLTATATDSDGTVDSVVFFSTSAGIETAIGTSTQVPDTNTYTLNWTPTLAGNYAIIAKATDNETAVTSSAPVTFTVDPIATNTAPTVALTFPLAGASIEENTPITLSAAASDSDGTISSVAFYDGTTLIGNGILSNSTYHFTWASATVGSHTITALATDDDNETTQTAPINIEVTPVVVITPVVTITAPTAVSEVNTPITLVASASNIAGEISSVAFISTEAGTETTIGIGTLVPDTNTYTFSWTPTIAGDYAISAVVTNDAAVEVISLPMTFTIDAVVTEPNVLPVVSVTPPTASTLVNTPIVLTASATDSDGTIDSVVFFSTSVGGVETAIGTGTQVPNTNTYSLNWTPTLAGNYAIIAKATDNETAETTSAAVTFTVDPVVTTPTTQQLGAWDFNEGAGAIATDNSGNAQTLQLNNMTWTTGKVGAFAGQFNGSNANGAPSAPALIDTTASFTVAAWVKLDTLNGWRTILNQDGENVSGFWLQYSQQIGGIFTFTMREDDTLSGPVSRTRSSTKPVIGEWYHLVGVRDAQNGIIKLYVNGVLESSVAHTKTWSATGDFNVGRGKWHSPNDWFSGAIDEVKVYNYPITGTEINALYQAGVVE